jgi:NAD+ diphosphatase
VRVALSGFIHEVSPCVIVLVSKGEKILLAAAAGFQKRFYSTLAGFMEPGETCEDAVVREVREEVGIEVGNVHYFSSQPLAIP